MKKQVKVLLLLAMILVMAAMTMLVSSAALDAEQGDNAYSVATGNTVNGYAATLADAIANANAGDTITLLKDVTETTGVTVDKAITVNGNGKTLTFGADVTGDAITLGDATATLQSITVVMSCTTGSLDTTNKVTTGAHVVATAGTGTLTLSDVVLKGGYNTLYFNSKATIIVDGAASKLGEGNGYHTVMHSGAASGAELQLKNGAIDNSDASGDLFAGYGTLFKFTMTGGVLRSKGDVLYSWGGGMIITITGNSVIESAQGINPQGANTVITIGEKDADNSGIVLNNTSNAIVVRGENSSAVIYGGKITAGGVAVSVAGAGSSAVIWDGDITAVGKAITLAGTNNDLTIHGGCIQHHTAEKYYLITAGDSAGGNSGNVTINGGTFRQGANTHIMVVYDGVSVNINGGFYTYHDTITEVDINWSAVPVNSITQNASHLGAYLKTSQPVRITGGTWHNGGSNYNLYFPSGVTHDVVISGGTYYGYRDILMSSTAGSVVVTDGNFYGASGHANHKIIDLQSASGDAKLYIFGGTFDSSYCKTNITTQSGGIFVYTKQYAKVYVYGGTFISPSTDGGNTGIVRFDTAGEMNLLAGEIEIGGVKYSGNGPTFNRSNTKTSTGMIFRFVSAATLNISAGTFITDNTQIWANDSNVTGIVTPNVADDATIRPTFHLTRDTLDEFPYETWKECNFVLHNVAGVDISPFANDFTGVSFEGNFNGTVEAFCKILTEAIHNAYFSQEIAERVIDGDTSAVTWVTSADVAELLADVIPGIRQQVTVDITSLDDIDSIVVNSGAVSLTFTDFPATLTKGFAVVNGGQLTLNKVTTQFGGHTFVQVNGGEAVLNDCNISATSAMYYIVHVKADGAVARINGGTYANNTGKIFTIGLPTAYDAKQYVDSYPNARLYITDATMYQTDGFSVITYGGQCFIDNCYITFSKDIARDEMDYNATSKYTGANINAIWNGSSLMEVKNSTIYSYDGSAAFINRGNDTGVLNIINCEAAGYRILYSDRGTTNIYGGNYFTNPGQSNHTLFTISGAASVLNIYGGSFTAQELTSSSTAIGMFYFTSTGTVNVYGGTFTSKNLLTDVALVNMAAAGTFNMPAKGTSYTDYAGVEQTSEGATLIRTAAGPIFWNQAGTINVAAGNAIRVSSGAYVLKEAEGTTFTINGATVYVTSGGAMPEDEQRWANTYFEVDGAASVELPSGSYSITDAASAITLAKDILTSEWKNNTYIVPDVNLTANISSYVPFTVKEGVTLTFNGNLTMGYDLFTLEGGTVIFEEGTYTATGPSLGTVESGTLNINGGSFTCVTNLFALEGGKTVVTNGTFIRNETATAYRSFFSVANTAALDLQNGTYTIKNGGNVVWGTTNCAATITISGGTYKKWNNADNGFVEGDGNYGAAYAEGAILRFDGTNVTASVTISGGEFTSNSILCVYAENLISGAYNEATGVAAEKGVTLTVTGGKFIGNADAACNANLKYMFHIPRPGGHKIEITGDDVVVEASAYQTIFCLNASSSTTNNVVNIHGGTYNGGLSWIFTNQRDAVFSIKNATFTDTAGIGRGQDSTSMMAFTGVANKVTFGEGTVVDLSNNNQAYFINGNNSPEIVFEGGTYIINWFLYDDPNGTFTVNDGLFIFVNENPVGFDGRNYNGIFRFTKTYLNGGVIVAKANPLHGDIALNAYSADINYAGKTFKVWAKNAATDATKAPVLESGAALYVSTENKDTSGIRFATTIAGSVIEALETAGYTVAGYGTVIAPADYVALAGEFTMAALDAVAAISGVKYVNIPAVNTLKTADDGTVTFSGALVSLNSNTRAYAAVSYIMATKGGVTEYFYSAYDSTANARTAEQIADAMIAAGTEYALLSDLAKAIVDEYAAGVVK